MTPSRLLLVALVSASLLAGTVFGYSSGDANARAQVAPRATPTFVISGRGWGHGVGLAQWGAYGFAQHGATYDEILAHYYTGTTLGPAPLGRVRVQLAAAARRVTVGSRAPYMVHDGIGQAWHLPAGDQSFGPGLLLRTTDFPQPQQLPPPLTFAQGASPLRFAGRGYRGQLVVSVANGALRAINSVGLEAYLFGVVPSEMPRDWLPEALKAQAVAARSYALAKRKTGSWFDLFADTRSQVYLGIPGEAASTTAAVQETAGEVVLSGGRLATTYFYSSSGGRTASADEVWKGPPVPYLQSVDDPYDTISPHHRWGPFTVAASRLARVLGSPGRLTDVRTTTGPSGRVQTVTAVGANGGESSMSGSDFRRALDLRSTWFRIGVLSLAPPDAPVTFGGRISLSGVARSLPAVKLEQRESGASWRPMRSIAPGPRGSVTVAARPRASTDYRLASGTARSRIAHVAVAPLVRFRGLKDASTLRGRARPAFPGASVAVQRLAGGRWVTVARAQIDANGDFEAHLTLSPGDYRARLAPGHGFVAGVSATLHVGPA
ncbi:MAG: SpoIID/LytB domain-containing protein [Actinomycetota bacterium]